MRIHASFGVRCIEFLSIGCILLFGGAANSGESGASKIRSVQVTGTGTDMLNGAIVYSKKQTPNGMIQQSTETVELKGDLDWTGPIPRNIDVRLGKQQTRKFWRSSLFRNNCRFGTSHDS